LVLSALQEALVPRRLQLPHGTRRSHCRAAKGQLERASARANDRAYLDLPPLLGREEMQWKGQLNSQLHPKLVDTPAGAHLAFLTASLHLRSSALLVAGSSQRLHILIFLSLSILTAAAVVSGSLPARSVRRRMMRLHGRRASDGGSLIGHSRTRKLHQQVRSSKVVHSGSFKRARKAREARCLCRASGL